jgi:hypothetical protein
MCEEVYKPSLLIVTQRNPGKFAKEESLLIERARELDVPFVGVSEKMMMRGKVPMPEGCMVAGSLKLIKHALRLLGFDIPVHTPYPEILKHNLHRKVWTEKTLKRVITQVNLTGIPLFVKPMNDWKTFTGTVITSPSYQNFNSEALNSPVWVSEVVTFVSEWRSYVVDGKVLDMQFCNYGGDKEIRPEKYIIQNAVMDYYEEDKAPSAYVIDFGVLDTGETALVEVNDGFSFGAYGTVSKETYWDVTATRWRELTRR